MPEFGARVRHGLRMVSLRWRITIGATAMVLFASLIVALAVAGLLRGSLARSTEELLNERVSAVEAIIAAGDLGPILESTGREIGQVQVIDAAGIVVSNTSGLAATTRFDVLDAPPPGERVATTVKGASIDNDPGEQYRVISATVDTPDGPLSIFAVTSLDTSRNAQAYLTSRLVWALPIFGLVTGAVIHWVVGRALRPVEEMRRRVEVMSATELTGRLELGPHDDEFARLGTTLNGFLGRLDASARQQRLFAANASHELRSPLSAMRTDLEVGLAYPERTDWERTARDALAEIERLERLSRDLRSLTREQHAAGPVVADVVAVLHDEIGRRSSSIIRLGPNVDVAEATIARDDLVQVMRILLDNAERHAASAIDVAVAVVAAEDGGDAIEICVANDGPAIGVGNRERIFEPFTRLDEARSLDDGGSGLGLAIARSILRSAGGTVTVADRSDGAAFVVRLPAGSPVPALDRHHDDRRHDDR